MKEHVDAGSLRDHIEVLAFQQDEKGDWVWESIRHTWGHVTLSTGRNLFSSIGIGARDVAIILRRQELSLHHALRWKGQFLFLSALLPAGQAYLEARAALVCPVDCQMDVDLPEPGGIFPGILTERYARHEQMDPLGVVTQRAVLVTPKAVSLSPGAWVTCGGCYYRVLVPHELDEYKNEYELQRKEDC